MADLVQDLVWKAVYKLKVSTLRFGLRRGSSHREDFMEAKVCQYVFQALS